MKQELELDFDQKEWTNTKYITWAKDIPEMDGVQKLGDVNSMGHP